jgi:ribosomal-protein-alanine N-acetyltransferase
MKGPVRIETSRLVLRKPIPADATEIYIRYASDPDVTRYLAWPTHTSIDQTRLFLTYSNAEWDRWPAGPYLIEDRSCGKLLGGTGLAFEAPEIASTGYVLARDAWGQGYATEALRAIVELAPEVGIRSLYAICHADHKASIHVLEKCGFQLEENLLAQFPNLDDGCQANCLRYVLQTD